MLERRSLGPLSCWGNSLWTPLAAEEMVPGPPWLELLSGVPSSQKYDSLKNEDRIIFFLNVVLAHRNICCHTKSASCLVNLRFGRTVCVSCAQDRLCYPPVVALAAPILQGLSLRAVACFLLFSVSLFCLIMFSSCPSLWYPLFFLSLEHSLSLVTPILYIYRATQRNFYNSPFTLGSVRTLCCL